MANPKSVQDTTSYDVHEYWSQQFHLAKVQPRRIAGNAPNMWAIATNKLVYRLVSGVWEQVIGMDSIISISVGWDGTVVVVREGAGNWMFEGGSSWKELPGPPLVQVSVGSKNHMVGRNIDNDVFYWDGACFRPLMVIVADKKPAVIQSATPVTPATPAQQLPVMQVTIAFNAKQFKMIDVSVAQDGTMVGVTQKFEPCRWDGISWRIIPGKHMNTIYAASRSQIVGIDRSLSAWRYVGNGNWLRLGLSNCKQLQITPSGIYWGLIFNTSPTPQDMILDSQLPVYIIRGYPSDPTVDGLGIDNAFPPHQ